MKLHFSQKTTRLFSLDRVATYLLLFGLSVFAVSCANDKLGVPTPTPKPVITPEYSFDTDLNSNLLYQDNEMVASPVTSNGRRFEIGKVLQVMATTQTYVQIINFAPVDIEDATILMTLKGFPKPIQLFKIKRIRAHATRTIPYPFINGDTRFLDIDGATVNLEKYKTTGINPDEASFDFTGKTPLITKLKSLAKLKWNIEFKDLHIYEPSIWIRNPAAKDIRRLMGLLINVAYLFQKEEMKTEFINEDIIGNDGVTFLTKAEKEYEYNKLLNLPLIYCSTIINNYGYAGPVGIYGLPAPVYGINELCLDTYIDFDQSFVTVHEFGHILGYSHASSMTYPINMKGFTNVSGRISNRLMDEKDFPIRLDNYYKISDFKKR